MVNHGGKRTKGLTRRRAERRASHQELLSVSGEKERDGGSRNGSLKERRDEGSIFAKEKEGKSPRVP